MTSPFSSFLPEFEKLLGRGRGGDFIRTLNQIRSSSSRAGNTTTIIQQTVTENITGGGTSGGGGGADSQTVYTSTPLLPGSLCYYAGATVQVADSNTAYEALWYVESSNGNTVVVRKWVADGDVLETGTADDGSGILYLYRNGGVTRNKADLVDSSGYPVSGVLRVQVVGTWNALSTTQPSGSSYIRGAINLLGASGG